MPKTNKIIKNRNLNVKFPNDDYEFLQEISTQLGTSMSSLIRLLINSRLEEVRKTKDPKSFLSDIYKNR